MKPAPFAYYAPSSVADALDAISRADDPEDLKVLAGGQSLVPMLNLRLAQPGTLLDINKLGREWRSMGARSGHGAGGRARPAARGRTLSRRDAVVPAGRRGAAPGDPRADPHPGHHRREHRARRPGRRVARRRPGAGCAAAHHRPPRRAQRPGLRLLPGVFTTALAPDELLSRIDFPRLPAGTGTSFAEVSRRRGDFALVAAAAVVTVREDRIADARLPFAGVAPCPVRSAAAESMLRGAEPTPDVVQSAAQAAAGALTPQADVHGSASYRRHIARVLARKALTTALERAPLN